MFQTLKNAWHTEELRKKIVFTLFILLLFRLGAAIPVPFISSGALQSNLDLAGGSLFAYMNILSGEAFSRATLFALSVSPYITASIVMQLLGIAIPALERLSKDEEGRNKINQWTRIVTVILAIATAVGYLMYMDSAHALTSNAYRANGKINLFAAFVIVACYTAGSAMVMWLAEKINEKGLGNGISLILFVNILASAPTLVQQLIGYFFHSDVYAPKSNAIAMKIFVIATIIVAVAVVFFVVFITNSERRIRVEYAKKTVGRKQYGGQRTTLPIKLNMSGVMPIIFANSIVAIPATIEMIFSKRIKEGGFWEKFFDVFAYDSWVYAVIFFVLIIAFSYFYIAISFNPVEVANNLQKNGGFVPGLRPGKPTSDYITKVLNRITLIGALFLGIIAVFPLIVNMISNTQLASLAFGGSSLLIVVGVILETARELEAQITMRHYKGFLE